MICADRVSSSTLGRSSSSRRPIDRAQHNVNIVLRASAARRVAVAARASTDAGADADAAQLGRRRALLAALLAAAPLSSPRAARAAAVPPADGDATVFVAGATGQTGRRVVQQLRAAGYKVRAGVRDLRKAQSLGFALDPAGIELVTADVVKQSVG